MKRSTRICLIIAGACIGFGVLLTAIGFLFGGRGGIIVTSKGKMEFSHDMETEESDDYSGIENIKVDVYNYPIEIIETDSDTVKCEYTFNNNVSKPTINVVNHTLTVTDNDSSNFWLNFNFLNWSGNEYIKIYVPKDKKLDNLNLETRNGAIDITANMTVIKLKAKSSNGRIVISDLTCKERASVNTSSGRIECNGDFKGVNEFVTSNGKVLCEGNYEGNTKLDTSNGRIEFTGTFLGGLNCQTSNGAIFVNCKTSRELCNIDAKTSNGSIKIDDSKMSDSFSENKDADNNLSMKTSNGSITADFIK